MRERRLSAYPFSIRCIDRDALAYELYGLSEEEIKTSEECS
jgi:hypothetical protein